MNNKILYKGVLGFAIGDALGVPVEFRSRASIRKDPVDSMRKGGAHGQEAGTWSDDTSMTLAAADSLQNGLNLEDIMKKFLLWLNHGEYTARGNVFDSGIATRLALRRYQNGTPPLECGGRDEYDNGNGALMRMLPVAVYTHDDMAETTLDDKLNVIDQVCSLTHGHMLSIVGCEIYTFLIWALMENPSMEAIAEGLKNAKRYYDSMDGTLPELKPYARLFQPDFADLPESAIRSTGFVVHTLEAAVWCLLNTEDFRTCALKAVNLGNDTDTVCAVACSMAALVYGAQAIPEQWVEILANKELIRKICLNDR